MEDESTSRYSGYAAGASTSTSTSTTIWQGDPIELPNYMRHSSRISEEDLEDDVVIPGEDEVSSNFDFNSDITVYCPICGSKSKARASEIRSNKVLGDVAVSLRIVNKLCECPEIYFQYGKLPE